MKNKVIITLSFALVTSFVMQLRAQELRTRDDAIKYLDKGNSGFNIIEKNLGSDGVEEEIIRETRGYYLANEYLIFKMSKVKYGNEIQYYDTKSLLINLADSLRLDKISGEKGTKTEKNQAFYITYKNYKICGRYTVNNADTKFKRNSLEFWNISVKDLYDAINILRTTYNPKEKTDFKLSGFKEDFVKAGNINGIPEEQRRYIVQANVANDAKDYNNALMLYQKALDVNKFTYPDAYFNMALIYGGLERYYQAIFAMKQYLILSPESADARKAQDKIYEWELNIKY